MSFTPETAKAAGKKVNVALQKYYLQTLKRSSISYMKVY